MPPPVARYRPAQRRAIAIANTQYSAVPPVLNRRLGLETLTHQAGSGQKSCTPCLVKVSEKQAARWPMGKAISANISPRTKWPTATARREIAAVARSEWVSDRWGKRSSIHDEIGKQIWPMTLFVLSRSGSWEPRTANPKVRGLAVARMREVVEAAIAAWVMAIMVEAVPFCHTPWTSSSFPMPPPDSLSWKSIQTVAKLHKLPGHPQRNQQTPARDPVDAIHWQWGRGDTHKPQSIQTG